eukprot:6180841-Pyramimonas_sp.AAC.1
MVDPLTLPPEWGITPRDLPPLGASPDGLLLHPSEAVNPPSEAVNPPSGGLLLHCLAINNHQAGIDTPAIRLGSGEKGVEVKAVEVKAEVVEVKTLCPFAQSETGSKHRR